MAKKKNSYCIIKKMPVSNGKTQNVILVDSHSEIQEWDTKEEVDIVCELFNSNTDSGFEYVVKKI